MLACLLKGCHINQELDLHRETQEPSFHLGQISRLNWEVREEESLLTYSDETQEKMDIMDSFAAREVMGEDIQLQKEPEVQQGHFGQNLDSFTSQWLLVFSCKPAPCIPLAHCPFFIVGILSKITEQNNQGIDLWIYVPESS